MNFKEYKESLKFRKYGKFKIIIRFIEHKFKDFCFDLDVDIMLNGTIDFKYR